MVDLVIWEEGPSDRVPDFAAENYILRNKKIQTAKLEAFKNGAVLFELSLVVHQDIIRLESRKGIVLKGITMFALACDYCSLLSLPLTSSKKE